MLMISQSNTEEKGMTAISTLIIFIAIVLIAGIGANVLINVTDSLENQAQTSGENTISEVSKQVDISSAYGNTSSSSEVTEFSLNVRKSAGSGDVDLSQATIIYESSDNQEVLVHSGTPGGGEFGVTAYKDGDGSLPVLNNNDRANVTVPLNDTTAPSGPFYLTAGEEASVTVDIAGGGSTTKTLTVPDVVESESTIALD